MKLEESKIKKLPAWAQQYIARLESDIKRWEGFFNTDNEETKVFIETYSVGKKYLPANKPITFKLDNGDVIDVMHEGDKIRALNRNSTMAIIPRVSNSIYLKSEDK